MARLLHASSDDTGSSKKKAAPLQRYLFKMTARKNGNCRNIIVKTRKRFNDNLVKVAQEELGIYSTGMLGHFMANRIYVAADRCLYNQNTQT